MCNITSVDKAHRYLYVDNFYTRHILGDKLQSLSNSEIFLTGTVRFTYVGPKDKTNL